MFIDWPARFDRRASHEFYVANTVRTGRNQFVGAFEGGDVGCRGRAGQDPGKRPSDRIKGNVRTRGRDEEGARRRASERDGRVKKGEERINGQLPENYIAANETPMGPRSGPGSRRNETRNEMERDRRRDFASDSMSRRIVHSVLECRCAFNPLIDGILSSLLLCLLSSEREPNCRDTGFNMPVAEFTPIIVSPEIALFH